MDDDQIHKSYGISTGGSPTVTTVHIVGKSRTFGGLQLKEWLFLIVSVVNILACVGLTIYRLVKVTEEDPNSPDFTFTILILVNAAFCAFYVVHGLLREMEFEVYAFIAAISVILIYCIIEYSVNVINRSDVKMARLIVGCVLAPINIILAVLVAREFGWLEFRIVGASDALQVMYRESVRFSSLLKFDLQLAASFVVLILQNGTHVHTMGIVTLACGLPFCLLWALIGWLGMRTEKPWAMGIFVFLGSLEPAYVLYKLVKVFQSITNTYKKIGDSDVSLMYTLMVVGAMCILVRAVVYIETWRVCKNFGKGLKERAFVSEDEETSSLLSAARRR